MKVNKVLTSLIFIVSSLVVGIVMYQYVYLPYISAKNIQLCTPYDFKQGKDVSGYYLVWNTKGDCSGYVKYGTTQGNFPYIAVDSEGVSRKKLHRVNLSGIGKGDTYYFVIISNDSSYGLNGTQSPITFD